MRARYFIENDKTRWDLSLDTRILPKTVKPAAWREQRQQKRLAVTLSPAAHRAAGERVILGVLRAASHSSAPPCNAASEDRRAGPLQPSSLLGATCVARRWCGDQRLTGGNIVPRHPVDASPSFIVSGFSSRCFRCASGLTSERVVSLLSA